MLAQEVAAAEARKAGLELRVTVVSEERKKLEAQLASLQGGVSQSEAELLQAQEAIATIKDQVCCLPLLSGGHTALSSEPTA